MKKGPYEATRAVNTDNFAHTFSLHAEFYRFNLCTIKSPVISEYNTSALK